MLFPSDHLYSAKEGSSKNELGERDSSVVKKAGTLKEDPDSAPQPSLSPVPGNLTPFSDFLGQCMYKLT